jgi:hypothetical protein
VGEFQQGEESRRNCCSRRIHAQGTRARAIRCRTSGEGLAPGMFTRIALERVPQSPTRRPHVYLIK